MVLRVPSPLNTFGNSLEGLTGCRHSFSLRYDLFPWSVREKDVSGGVWRNPLQAPHILLLGALQRMCSFSQHQMLSCEQYLCPEETAWDPESRLLTGHFVTWIGTFHPRDQSPSLEFLTSRRKASAHHKLHCLYKQSRQPGTAEFSTSGIENNSIS